MGLLLGYYNYHTYQKWNQGGKDAFIAHELQRFEKYVAHPRPMLFTLASTTIGYAFIFGFYELIAAALSKLLPSSSVTSSGPTVGGSPPIASSQ